MSIVIDNSFISLPTRFSALTVNLAVPSAVGVPLISPVSLFRLRPAGRPPFSMLHMMGVVPLAVRVWRYASSTLPPGRVSVVMAGANCAISVSTVAGTLSPGA